MFKFTIQPPETGRVKPVVHFLNMGLEYAGMEVDLDEIKESIKDGRMELWTVKDMGRGLYLGAALIKIINQGSVLFISTIGGTRLDEWINEGIKFLENYAKNRGIDSIEIVGRRGWVRKLQPYEYKEMATIVKKELK